MHSVRLRNEKKHSPWVQGAHSSEGKPYRVTQWRKQGTNGTDSRCPSVWLPGQESSEEGVQGWEGFLEEGRLERNPEELGS